MHEGNGADMKTTFKRIVFAGIALAVFGAWTIWVSERLYRYGYDRGRSEYRMDDKERYGVREWLEKHPEDAEKILGSGRDLETTEFVTKHPTFWTDADNWLFPL